MYNAPIGGFMSDSTTVAKFREKLAGWLDTAKRETVFINRGDERFALMSEEAYREFNQKISDLQSSLIATLESKDHVTKENFDGMLSKLSKYKRKKA